jgi:rifampicin phosphotransferase
MKYLLQFEDPLAIRVEYSGGKGANLSFLRQRGFPVPAGFLVTSQAYRDFIDSGKQLLRGIPDLPFDDPAKLREASHRLIDSLRQLPMPAGLDPEIRTILKEFPEPAAFSVRSSSTMEDMGSAAFAGQYETFLNCMGPDQILDKVKSCFLSFWNDRAIVYRQRQGFDHLMAAMAVVVQTMISCDVSGVGFTVNAVSGDLGEMVVNANFGLGESVVSGESDVDHYIFGKASRTLRHSQIAEKKHKMVLVPGGTQVMAIPQGDTAKACLEEPQILRLLDLMIRVEQSYGFPQDLEWGFAGKDLYLFQSRPITAIPPRWTRDESAERFPNVLTPLTWDFVEEGFHRSLNYSFRLMNYPPFSGKWFGMHGHYIYGNQNAVQVYGGRLPISIRSLEELRAAIPKIREEYRWVQELPTFWSRDLDYYLIQIGLLLAEPLESKDLKEVWEFVCRVSAVGTQYFLPNIAISLTQAVLHRVLIALLQLLICGKDATRLFDGLLAYCETKTGNINKELFEMALLIRACPELLQLVQKTHSREIISQRLLSAFSEFDRRFEKFLRDHGHREVDFDAYHATWLEAPWAVLDSLRLILQAPIDQTPAMMERDLKIRSSQSEFELFKRLPEDLHFFFHELIRLTRMYTTLDDVEHYQTTRLTLPLRKGLRELGQRLVARGILREPLDIFFARSQELGACICEDKETRWKKFSESIQQEKCNYLLDRDRTPEWILGEQSIVASTGEQLTGLPGSPGQAEGPVFQVLNPDDFAGFPKGSVLVARTTNPTWTPLFYGAAAVITESGGPLSHGAVTAREIGIPAVMSVHSCFDALKNGDRVWVDGTRGLVGIIERIG